MGELGNNDAATVAMQSKAESASTEAQEADEDDDLWEGVGRGAASLSTTGSFTLSAGGVNDKEEDELGEGVGRGAASLSTTGSFTLSAGGSNDKEEDEM